jgi:hypothetical protein
MGGGEVQWCSISCGFLQQEWRRRYSFALPAGCGSGGGRQGRRGGCAAARRLAGLGGVGVHCCWSWCLTHGRRSSSLWPGSVVEGRSSIRWRSASCIHGKGAYLRRLDPSPRSEPRDVGHPLPLLLLAEQASLPLPHPKWHVPRRWGGGRSSAVASVAWSEPRTGSRSLFGCVVFFCNFAGCVL